MFGYTVKFDENREYFIELYFQDELLCRFLTFDHIMDYITMHKNNRNLKQERRVLEDLFNNPLL